MGFCEFKPELGWGMNKGKSLGIWCAINILSTGYAVVAAEDVWEARLGQL